MLPFGLSILGPLSKAIGQNHSVEKMLCLETYRLKTFEGWPLEAYNNVRPMELARNGFYYTGQDDIVKCFSCGVKKGQWEVKSRPKQEHEHLNPNCSYIRGFDERNVPFFVPDEEDCKSIQEKLHKKYCRDTDGSKQQLVYNSRISGDSSSSTDGRSGSNGLYHNTVSQSTIPLLANTPSTTLSTHVDHNRPDSSTAVLPCGYEENLHQMSEMLRLQTFEGRWPHTTPTPADLAKAGFTYTGIADRVECAFCKGILKNWEEEDIPMSEHAKHFSLCPFVKEYQKRQEQQRSHRPVQLAPRNTNFFNNFEEIERMTSRENPNSFSPENGIHTEKPRHPHYVTEASRIATYTNWPSGKSQTPQQLAKAGFIYIGLEDNVKCFFCDGGLRKWERGDDPWEEHAKYFPRCQYVLQVKGEAFVQQCQNSNREISQAAANGVTAPQSNQTFEAEIITSKINNPVVQDVLKMGVPEDVVVNVIKERIQTTAADFISISDLLNAIYHTTDASNDDTSQSQSRKVEQSHKEENTIQNIIEVGDTDSNVDHESLLIENRRLKEQRTCKICMDEEANIVLLPCGHLVSCATCAPALRMCPICRANIKGTVRTYLS